MDIQSLLSYLLSKKGSLKEYPFGEGTLVVKVTNKMFALLSEKSVPLDISLKCDPFIAESLRQQYFAITPGYHLNKSHWNTIRLDGSLTESEVFQMIDHSYDLVVKGLRKAEREALLQL